MLIMKLNPVILICCCLFTGEVMFAQTDLPFALEWKVGKTYCLDVRQEERKYYEKPYHRDFILLERVTWSFQVLQKKGDSIFLKAVPLRYRSQRGSLNDGNYFDSQYHQEPETYDTWNLCDKAFLIIVNPQGKVLGHQIMMKGKPVETKSKLKAKPFLWEIEPPVLEEQFQWSLAHKKDQYEVEPFIRIFDYSHNEKEAYLTHYHFGKNQQLSIDNTSRWIKYGTFTETKADGTQKNIWIRGWSDPEATVKGKFTHFKTKGGIREKDELLSYLRFRCGVKAQFDLYTDGSFSLKIPLARNIAFELFDVPIFLSPGDHLTINADFNQQSKAIYRGNCASENELIRLLMNRDTLQNKYMLKWTNIINSKKGAASYYKEVKQDFIQDSILIFRQKKAVNPFCFWDAFWSHRYKEAWNLLEFNSISKFPDFEQLNTKKNFSRIESLPVLNDWCEYSYEYPNFLSYRYPGFRVEKLRTFHVYPSSTPKTSINSLAKFILTGDPLVQVLYQNISNTYVFLNKDYPNLEAEAADFIRTCPDTILAGNIRKFHDTEQRLISGRLLPNFEVYNLKGKKLNAKKLRGKKTIFHLELGSHSFGHIEYAKLTKRHPSLNIVHIYPLPHREFKQKFSGKNLPPPYTEDNLFFPKDLKTAQLIHDRFCFNESTKWNESAYNRLYFVNEASVISDFMDNSAGDPRQIRADFAYRLQPFLAQKSALKPNLSWLYILLANLLLVGTFLALRTRYIRRREARKRRLTEMELKSLRAQLNPHFIFNTMGSIQHLIASQQSEKANDYLADLAALMRLVLRATQKGIISLREELDLVEQYCALENLRKPFTLHLDIAPELDVNACEVPALLLQPYVENAILHGLTPINTGGKIELHLWRDGPNVLISIQDNGVGIQQARQKNSNGTQSGLKMNQERLQLMYGSEAGVHIVDLAEKDPTKSGTLVTLKLPCC